MRSNCCIFWMASSMNASRMHRPSHRLQRSHRKVRKRFLSWIQAATRKSHVGTRTIFCRQWCGVTETDDDNSESSGVRDENPKPKHHASCPSRSRCRCQRRETRDVTTTVQSMSLNNWRFISKASSSDKSIK